MVSEGPLAAYAPASIGNLAAGFDVLGAAIAPLGGGLWGDVVEIAAGDDAFEATGRWAARLPSDPRDNLVLHARRLLEREIGRPLAPCRVTLRKELPLGSGLGSSSASIVAALVAFDAWAGSSLDHAALLRLAGAGEAIVSGAPHLDNVAPALLGGVQLVTAEGGAHAVPFPDDLVFVLVHPGLELTTAASRAALPAQVPLRTAVAFAQNLAAFVHALHARDRALLARTFRDPLAEPHRAPLVPPFAALREAAQRSGALAFSLSGSGPSVFAVFEGVDAAEAACPALDRVLRNAGLAGTVRACTLDRRGARLL